MSLVIGIDPGVNTGFAVWDKKAQWLLEVTSLTIVEAFDRLDETAILEGGVNVIKGDKTLATLTCDKGSVAQGLDAISDLKSGIGQCWDYDSQSWRTGCE